MPKATFSVLIGLFCQIHHFPRTSSAPLPIPLRFLPNHWLIANFLKVIIFCKKSHLPAISFTYFALICCFSHIGHLQGATLIILNFHLTLGSFVPNSSLWVSFPMLLKLLLPLVNSHQTLSCQSQIHLFPGGGLLGSRTTTFNSLSSNYHSISYSLFNRENLK